MPDLEKAVRWAIGIAGSPAHGYDQPHRMGGIDYDCSSLVQTALKVGGFSVPGWMWTGNEIQELTRRGWKWHPGMGGARRGDILWKPGHTAIHIGGDTRVEAWMNEFNGASGGAYGDQTGQEIRVHAPANDDNFSGYLRYTGQTGAIMASAGEIWGYNYRKSAKGGNVYNTLVFWIPGRLNEILAAVNKTKSAVGRLDQLKCTHIVFQYGGAIGVANVLAGTYHLYATRQEYDDNMYALRTSGARITTWAALRGKKGADANKVANPSAFGVKI